MRKYLIVQIEKSYSKYENSIFWPKVDPEILRITLIDVDNTSYINAYSILLKAARKQNTLYKKFCARL